jgi:hypothetical protein
MSVKDWPGVTGLAGPFYIQCMLRCVDGQVVQILPDHAEVANCRVVATPYGAQRFIRTGYYPQSVDSNDLADFDKD